MMITTAGCVINNHKEIIYDGDIATANMNIIRFWFHVTKGVVYNSHASIVHVYGISTVITASCYIVINKVAVGDCYFSINTNGPTIIVT